MSDVLRIWNAKSAGMDLGALLDVQLLCGAGLSRTKEFLAAAENQEARAALERIVRCEEAGDFADFSPADYLAYYREYFGA